MYITDFFFLKIKVFKNFLLLESTLLLKFNENTVKFYNKILNKYKNNIYFY